MNNSLCFLSIAGEESFFPPSHEGRGKKLMRLRLAPEVSCIPLSRGEETYVSQLESRSRTVNSYERYLGH